MYGRRAFFAVILGVGAAAPLRARAVEPAQRKSAPPKLTTVTLAVSGMT